MQETLNLKKGLKINKDQDFLGGNDIKIFKLKGCENFKFWKFLEVGQMAFTEQLFRGSRHCVALIINNIDNVRQIVSMLFPNANSLKAFVY